MTANELKRKLTALGCAFEEGKKHTLIIYNGRAVPMPRHPSKEIKQGTLRGIMKRLGLEDK